MRFGDCPFFVVTVVIVVNGVVVVILLVVFMLMLCFAGNKFSFDTPEGCFFAIDDFVSFVVVVIIVYIFAVV